MAMIVDIFTYNGERDLLKLHMDMLGVIVDKFVVVESLSTFTGEKKPLYFQRDMGLVENWLFKTDYYVNSEDYSEQEIELAQNSPNTSGAEHWTREFLQKERIKVALIDLPKDAICFIGDVDEIWDPWTAIDLDAMCKLKLRVYAYYLNNRSSEEFWGTLRCRYGDIEGECLNHVRSDTNLRTNSFHGWHFTSMGGVEEVRRKLNDSYSDQSYNTGQVQELLQQRVEKGVDYLGRPFSFKVDEAGWPTYLKQHRQEYAHLLV